MVESLHLLHHSLLNSVKFLSLGWFKDAIMGSAAALRTVKAAAG